MLVNEIAKNMQTGKQTDLILLDFSKAFDKVAHEKLISKLYLTGIYVPSTVFQSFRDDGRVNMKGSVQWSAV